MRELLQCEGCGVCAVTGANVELDEKSPPVPLRRTPLVRRRQGSSWECPNCQARLQALVLAWGVNEVVIEACDRCDMVVLDRGELERVEAMLADSSPLQSADLGKLDTPSFEPGSGAEADAHALERPVRRFLRRLGLK